MYIINVYIYTCTVCMQFLFINSFSSLSQVYTVCLQSIHAGETVSRVGPWYCPTRQAVNAWLSQHQSPISSWKFIRVSRERYITRSRGSQRCLLEAFTAFRLSIKDKVSRTLPFPPHGLALIPLWSRNADANSPRPVTKYRLYSTTWKKSRKGAQKLLLRNATVRAKRLDLKSEGECRREEIF